MEKDKTVKHITYSRDRYQGHDNEEIISLTNDLNDAMAEIRRIENEIKNIQNNCVHEYMLYSTGMYDDYYVGRKCGHDIWK
jgi:nitrite reductase/ring-hydroxylating ferredoxin subunit